jgi:uncharacterized membrane protein
MSEEIKQYIDPGKKNLMLIYLLYLAGTIIPILILIGGAFSFANINQENSVWRSHYVFAFRTFYLAIAAAFISMIVTIVFIIAGFGLNILFYIWFIVRIIIAMQLLMEESAHPNPLTLWIK